MRGMASLTSGVTTSSPRSPSERRCPVFGFIISTMGNCHARYGGHPVRDIRMRHTRPKSSLEPYESYATGRVISPCLWRMGVSVDGGKRSHGLSGRSDDMLIIRGINVFPSQIEHVLLRIPEVGNQFMVYIDRINHLDEMTVEVEINRSHFSGKLQILRGPRKKS